MLTIFRTPGRPGHGLDRLLAAVEGGMEVDLHLPGQFICRNVREVRHEAGARVVHQCVDPSEPGRHPVEEPSDGVGVGQVHLPRG